MPAATPLLTAATLLLLAVARATPRPATCCFPPGLTFDDCDAAHPCAPDRSCLTADTLSPCLLRRNCICYPHRIEACASSAQCTHGELCAARPYDSLAFCVSETVFTLDATFVVYDECCDDSLPVRPSHEKPPVVTEPQRTVQPTPTRTQTPTPTPTPTPTRSAAATSTAVVTKPRPSATPTSTPSIRPSRSPRPSTQPRPTPSRSKAPQRSPRPSPSPRPQVTAVQPVKQPRPSPTPRQSPPQRTRPPKPTGGLAGDPCRRRGDCLGYRKCVDTRTKRDCGGGDCVCVGSRICVCNDQCTDGEVCSGSPGRAYCFSPRLIESLSYAQALPCPVTKPTSTPSPKPRPSATGLTGETCRIDKNCDGERKCVAARGRTCVTSGVLCDGRQQSCTVGDERCYCYLLRECNCSLDCEDGEMCTSTLFGRICLSPLITANDSVLNTIGCPSAATGESSEDPILIVNLVAPENLDGDEQASSSNSPLANAQQDIDDQVCIDANALSHLHVNDLVYKTHRIARVLCDGHQSCATPGHMVVFNGRAMMMRTYCDLVSCDQRIMQVNSPRFKPSIRIPSSTDGLHFTAFAARYQTRMEEIALTTVVHAGL